MDPKRVTEWLGTANGRGKAAVALIGVLATIFAATTKAFEPVVDVLMAPSWASPAPAVILVALLVLWLGRSFRRFAQASRLERPDAFRLRPTNPASLIGRDETLVRLITCVKHKRLVLVDGESGCGKSALVTAGLVPSLGQSDGLLPIAISDWGDDWVRGPLAAAVETLFHGVTQTERDRLGWTSLPDLAADTETLVADLDARLKAVVGTLGHRPLLIADQFDDYQMRHRDRFLAKDGTWLGPTALARANRFWELVSAGLSEGRLHLLVVVRADTAAGLGCVRFLGEDQTAVLTLPRVEVKYLRPLLSSIAADDAQPAVVSNPAGGWHDLRERLERDLKAEGSILMQQVRTVLLGLRQLPLLTPRCYREVGGLRGVETLLISRAVRRAGDVVGGEAGVRAARALPGTLILPGGENRPPKVQRASLSVPCDIAGGQFSTEAILRTFQGDEVVRPAAASGQTKAWQLEHDYLARVVLAEARQADRWAVALREGKARYDQAAGDWRRQWRTLLSFGSVARVCWERARGRLTVGDAGSYLRVSATRLAVVVLCLALIGVALSPWSQDWLLTVQARRLTERFGGSDEADAVLRVWRSPAHLRQRVHDLVRADEALLERAVRTNWPFVHAGFEPPRVREAAAALRARLERERDPGMAGRLAWAYAAVVARLTDAADVKAAVATLGARLDRERDAGVAAALASAYAAVAARLTDAADVKAEAAAVRARLVREQDPRIAGKLAGAYAAVTGRLNDAADVKAAAATLRARLEQDPGVAGIAGAYAAVAGRSNDATDVKAAVLALRARLEREQNPGIVEELARVYAAMAARLTDAADVKAEAGAVRARLEREQNPGIVDELVPVYAAGAARLTDAADVKAEVAAVRGRLEREQDPRNADRLARAYAAVAARLTDVADVRATAATLQVRLEREREPENVRELAVVYAAVAARLTDPADVRAAAATLWARLERERDPWAAGNLARAYAAVAARLTDPADVMTAAATLRARLEGERNPWIAGGLAEAYAAVAVRTVERADPKDRSALVQDILVLASHPLVMDTSPLLSALKPAAGEDFGANVGAAVHWAQQTYDIRPDRLRPSPLQSWSPFTGSRS